MLHDKHQRHTESKNLKHFILVVMLSALIGSGCSPDDDGDQPYTIYVSASECFCEFRLYDVDGRQCGHDLFDCNRVEFCIFKVVDNGEYVVHADNGKTIVKHTFTVSRINGINVYVEF